MCLTNNQILKREPVVTPIMTDNPSTSKICTQLRSGWPPKFLVYNFVMPESKKTKSVVVVFWD